METVSLTKIEEIINHHVAAFVENDMDELMKDYTEASELLTPQGAMKGLNAIHSFFEEVFKILPKGTVLDVKQLLMRDNIAYGCWSAESPFVSVPLGTDTFIVGDEKILFQSLAAHIIPKQ